MKGLTITAAMILVTFFSSAQVTITSITQSGTLTWTNLRERIFLNDPGPGDQPIYRVDWAHSPTGSWNSLPTTVLNSFSITDYTNQSQTFYRVAWTNGEVWNYQGYDGESLVVTGKLYFGISHDFGFPRVTGGSWNLSRTEATGRVYRVGSGPLDSCLDCDGKIYLSPISDDTFWLDGPDPVSNTWTGAWHWSGFAGEVMPGTFIAEKIENGR